jgi:flagellar basal-body rod modification protein FlgD
MINSTGSLAAQAQTASAPTASSPPSSPSSATDPLANQNVFLQLLVAQLENQDPESPADGTTFITQLAQFSELSNSAQMLSDLDAIKQSLAAGSGKSTTTNAASTSTSSS